MLLVLAGAAVSLTVRGRGYSRGRLIFLAAVRVLLASCAVLAVAGVEVRLPSATRHVVFLVDRSPGFANRAASADALVAERRRTLPPDDVVTVLYFDRRASPDPSRRPEDATDLEAALDAGSAAIPPGHPGVIFLLTDGIETTGDASQAALRLAARGIPVFIPRPSPAVPADARVSRLDVPSVMPAAQSLRLTVHVDATRATDALLTISRDGTEIARGALTIEPGVPAVVTLVDPPGAEGLHVYAARVAAKDDAFPQNNVVSAPVFVTGRPLVLYLSGFAGDTPVLRLLQSMNAFRVRRLTSGDELTPEVLADAALVMLDNFPAERLGARLGDLASFVRDAGGGLVMIGGPASFGSGGYIDTAIDAVLPVHCDPRDADKKPLALVVLLDSSGSMGEDGGEKMEIARAAAARTLGRLTAKDAAAVVAFRITPEVVVPLGPVADPRALARTLAGITPTGGTNIFPALDRALAVLANSKAPLKHVILLSDGKTLPGDAPAVVDRYAKAGVTLSAVATGKDADRELLKGLSTWTHGRFYEASDIRTLADLFLDDLRRIDGPLLREGTLPVESAAPSALSGVSFATLPSVAAYNRTRLRDGATLVLKHTVDGADEPVLALRRAGLGRSAALTLSFDAKWSGDLADWPEWGALVAALARHVERTQANERVQLSVSREGGAFELTAVVSPDVEALPARPVVRISGTDGSPVDVPLTRSAARRWTGRAETTIDSVATAALLDGDAVLATVYVPTAYPKEFRELTPRVDVLTNIARMTGGAVVDNLDRFRVAGGRAARESRDATAWLVALVLAMFLVELIGRAAGRL